MNDFMKFHKRLWAIRKDWDRGIQFVLFERIGGKISHSTSISMYTPSEKELGNIIEPTFSLQPEEAQELMDNLWELGFRPSEGTGSAGALAATQRHLEDMRKLVFEKDVSK